MSLHRIAAKLPGSAGWVLLELVECGEVGVGALMDFLGTHERTIDRAVAHLEQLGVCSRSGNVVRLSQNWRQVLDIPDHTSAAMLPQSSPHDADKTADNVVTKMPNTVTDTNNPNSTDVSLGERGEGGLGFKAFDLAVDVEVQNQDQHQVQDQTQKPACASESVTPATSSPQPVNPEPRAVPFRSVRPPIPKPTPKLEQVKKPELEKPERKETEHEAIFAALAHTCYGGTGNLTKTVAGRIAGAAKQLRSAGYSAEDVGEINTWITTFEAWRGLVTPQTIVERAPAWGNDLKPASAPKPVNPNTQHRSHHLRADVQLERLQRERREREAAANGVEPTQAATQASASTVEVRRTQSAFPPQPLPGGPR